jgi:hypothetical protein
LTSRLPDSTPHATPRFVLSSIRIVHNNYCET